MSPTLVFAPDGRLAMVVGAAGGPTIPAQVIRLVIGMVDWKLSPEAALALPVLVPFGDTVFVEQGSFLEAMIPQLNQMGHAKVMPRALPLKAQAIRIEGRSVIGGADPRSEGKAITD
jgi:gamma-glutamyltranspeptidase/glutathione hydrolase